MTLSIRRQLRILQGSAALSFGLLAFLSVTAFTQPNKNTDKSATVALADGAGRPRLVMRVDADGNASIDFLDADGKTVQRIPSR